MSNDSQDDFEDDLDDYSLGYRACRRGEIVQNEDQKTIEWMRGWRDAAEDEDDRNRVRAFREGSGDKNLCFIFRRKEMNLFKKDPICEICNKEIATSFSFLVSDHTTKNGNWHFVCSCTTENEEYYIEIERFFSAPNRLVDWLSHMHEKTWMDWKDFMNMIRRFRHATDSYGSL